MTGPIWLCRCPGCPRGHCYVVSSCLSEARKKAAQLCPSGSAPCDVRYAGYSQEPWTTVRPKGMTQRRIKRFSGRDLDMSELTRRVRYLIEMYQEARESGSIRSEAAIRDFLADVGAAIERTSDEKSLVEALDGEDDTARVASFCTMTILMENGYTHEEAKKFVEKSRMVHARFWGGK